MAAAFLFSTWLPSMLYKSLNLLIIFLALISGFAGCYKGGAALLICTNLLEKLTLHKLMCYTI